VTSLPASPAYYEAREPHTTKKSMQSDGACRRSFLSFRDHVTVRCRSVERIFLQAATTQRVNRQESQALKGIQLLAAVAGSPCSLPRHHGRVHAPGWSVLTPRLPEGVATRSRLSTASHGFEKEAR